MLDSVLRAAGYRVGLYTSPYITIFNERMRVNGANIPNDTLAEITEYVRPIAEKMTDKPTEFELITAIAFEYFKREKCDLVILEAGMGGRLDSTNIISTPLLSVITGIALDHTAFLGDTVEKIAAEKAGIIKNAPLLWGGEDAAARAVIKKRADECAVPFIEPDYSLIDGLAADLRGTRFSYRHHENVKINLLGLYQPKNASLVLEAADAIDALGMPVPESAILSGLESARWSARFEIINHSPLVIFDGAHNPQGISVAVESIAHYFGDRKVAVITGVLKDKDYEYIASRLATVAAYAFTITPDNPRALSAEEYAQVLCKNGVSATPTASIAEAVALALSAADKRGDAIVCLGSLYTYCEILPEIEKLGISKRR
jgi:dihydrofolate synthase/folylpolyglutamate synthase